MSKKHIITLNNIDTDKIDQKYGFVSETKNITKIEELETKNPLTVSFLDESKKIKNCTISFVNFKKNKYKCFWDKNHIPDGVIPIGCPIRYIPNRISKTYNSEIKKESYTIQDSITPLKVSEVLEKSDNRLSIIQNDFYETDGIFCSFNCCMAYIQENKSSNSLYANSEMLLLQMFNMVNNFSDYVEIIPAPSWRLLIDFGGHLTIEKFRESFNKITYSYNGEVSCSSIGHLYEDKIRF